jgi:transcription elongation factor Elf1
MFILMGLRRVVARLGTTFLLCPYCQTPAAQAVTRVRRWFTVFFIPVVPLGAKYVITCTMCGRATQVAQETADAYVASAAGPGVGGPAPAAVPAADAPATAPTAETDPAEGA